MIKEIEVNEDVASSISQQLWRYYDIELDVHPIMSYYGEGEYRIYGDTEYGVTDYFVKMKMFYNKIEDLYVNSGGIYIEPTTSREEQENR